MLQRKLNSDHFGGWSGCFLCSSGTFPRAFGVANPRAPDSSAPERSADVGTKRTAEAPGPNSPVRRLPSARCHVCSSANLEKCSLRTAPVHQGRSVDFPDVELVRAMSPQLVLWRGGGGGVGRRQRRWLSHAHAFGIQSPSHLEAGTLWRERALGLSFCIFFAWPFPKLSSGPGVKCKHIRDRKTRQL